METNTVDIAAQFTWRILCWMARTAWLGWGLPVALAAFLGFREIGTADFWWQWATGRHIFENGIPSHDPWLTTPAPRPWIEMRWLYCAALYWVVENVGAWLAIVSAAGLYAAGVGFSLVGGGRAAPSWLAATGVAVATVLGRRVVVRPEAFTILFLGLVLFLILRIRQGRLNPKWGLAWVGVIQVLWANTHALFALSSALCALWLVVELFEKSDRRIMALGALAVTVVCSLINPYGVAGALYPFLLFEELHVGAYKNNIIELQTPFAFGLTPSLIAHLLMAGAVTLFAFQKRGDKFALLATIATFYLSITIVRNAPLFALCAAAYISTCDLKPNRLPAMIAAASAAVIAYSFAIGTWTVEDRLGFRISEGRYPMASARAIKGVSDNVFNTLVEGSLLIAQRDKVYCDPRLEVLPQERFVEMLDISRLRKPLPQKYDVVFLIIDCPLAAKLVRDGGWRLMGFDAVGISMIREPGFRIDLTKLPQLAFRLLPQYPSDFSWFSKALSPVPYRRLAMFFRNIGDDFTADILIAEARRIYPQR